MSSRAAEEFMQRLISAPSTPTRIPPPPSGRIPPPPSRKRPREEKPLEVPPVPLFPSTISTGSPSFEYLSQLLTSIAPLLPTTTAPTTTTTTALPPPPPTTAPPPLTAPIRKPTTKQRLAPPSSVSIPSAPLTPVTALSELTGETGVPTTAPVRAPTLLALEERERTAAVPSAPKPTTSTFSLKKSILKDLKKNELVALYSRVVGGPPEKSIKAEELRKLLEPYDFISQVGAAKEQAKYQAAEAKERKEKKEKEKKERKERKGKEGKEKKEPITGRVMHKGTRARYLGPSPRMTAASTSGPMTLKERVPGERPGERKFQRVETVGRRLPGTTGIPGIKCPEPGKYEKSLDELVTLTASAINQVISNPNRVMAIEVSIVNTGPKIIPSEQKVMKKTIYIYPTEVPLARNKWRISFGEVGRPIRTITEDKEMPLFVPMVSWVDLIPGEDETGCVALWSGGIADKSTNYTIVINARPQLLELVEMR